MQRGTETAGLSDGNAVQIVVPIYNEGENVKVLYSALLRDEVLFDSLSFIYDRDDETALPFIKAISEKDRRVGAEKNGLTPGVLNALRWGFSKAKPGPVIVIMGDNSDKLSIVPGMIDLWKQGAAIVSPSRYMPGGKQHGGPPLKTLLSKTAGKSLKLFGFPTSDATNNFKLYDGTWVAQQQIESKGGFEVALELCCKAFEQDRLIEEVPTEWFDREAGKSKFKLFSWLPRYLGWYFRALAAIAKKRIHPGQKSG